MTDWLPAETNTHQEHVIAHVLGATVLGYFRADQAAYLLLDIGFIWSILLDGEMGLVPQRMALAELNVDEAERAALSADADALYAHGPATAPLTRTTAAPDDCLLTAVEFYTNERGHRLLLQGEGASLCVETELTAGTIEITPLRAA